MTGTFSKAISKARKSLDKVVANQKRKRVMAKAGDALKTAGKAAAVIGVIAGSAWAARTVSKKRAAKQLASKRKRVIAATATAVGVTAIAARVRRGKRG